MSRWSKALSRVIAAFCLLVPCADAWAGDVVILGPRNSILKAANDNVGLMFQAYHVFVSDFAPGDLVLTRSNFFGEVMAVRDDKLIVEGRFLSGSYAPQNFVKEVQSVRGIKVGSLIKDGAGYWGHLIRAWEDGRIELSGRGFTSVPFPIDQMAIAQVLPPTSRPKNVLVRLCERLMRIF